MIRALNGSGDEKICRLDSWQRQQERPYHDPGEKYSHLQGRGGGWRVEEEWDWLEVTELRNSVRQNEHSFYER